MKRTSKQFNIPLTTTLKAQLLQWAQQFDEVVWLDSNHYNQKHTSYDAILAVDAFTGIKTDSEQAFKKLEEYYQTTQDWIFGYLSYDVKNAVEALQSHNHDVLAFPDLYFFQPKRIFLFSKNTVTLQYLVMVDDELESDWKAIQDTIVQPVSKNKQPVKISLRTTKDRYFEKVNTMLAHIQRGDIYEANFCQEFFAENTSINPLETYTHLNTISTPPFASFVKLEFLYALCASPERYLKKKGAQIISQPIKGTSKRATTAKEDQQLIQQLKEDPKERSENVMITDLVRNDLSRFAKKGSVIVEELCGIYTFEQVHQMISTVVCQVAPSLSPVEIIKQTFPMGSMTGAPKVSAMKIIETLEDAKRGLYSGAMGYFTPQGDFDFNVVIRTILYNEAKQYVSYSVGGAITAKSIPQQEYDECLLKAKAMREALSH